MNHRFLRLALGFAIAASTLCAGLAQAADDVTNKRAAQQLQAQADREIQAAGAPIQSLAAFQARRKDGSQGMAAFDKLPAEAQKEFLDRLVFGERGLAGFSYVTLKGRLGPQDAYRLLGMFGAQGYVARFVDDLPDQAEGDKLLRQALLASIPPRAPVRFADDTTPAAALWQLDLQQGEFRPQQDKTAQQQLTVAMYFSPSCGPCVRAAKDIRESPKLKRLFASCGRWVAQLDGSTDANALRQWSEQQDKAGIWAIRDWSRYGLEAPEGTPTFVLIRNGKVVQKLIGWPYEGSEAQLLKLVRDADPEHRCS